MRTGIETHIRSKECVPIVSAPICLTVLILSIRTWIIFFTMVLNRFQFTTHDPKCPVSFQLDPSEVIIIDLVYR